MVPGQTGFGRRRSVSERSCDLLQRSLRCTSSSSGTCGQEIEGTLSLSAHFLMVVCAVQLHCTQSVFVTVGCVRY